MREIWRKINDYENYEVSNMGNVRRNGRLLTQFACKKGYCRVALCKENIRKNMSVHRLVAIAFIPNPDDKETINHITTIKSDNSVCNLEWATHKEQMNHYWSIINLQ